MNTLTIKQNICKITKTVVQLLTILSGIICFCFWFSQNGLHFYIYNINWTFNLNPADNTRLDKISDHNNKNPVGKVQKLI